MYSHAPGPPPHLDSAGPFVPGVSQPLLARKADPSSLHTRQWGQNCCTTCNKAQPASAEPCPASSHQLSRAPSASLRGGRAYSPSVHTLDRHRAQELRSSLQLAAADTGVSLQGGASILGSQPWSHFYCPSLDHPTETLKRCVIPQR